MNLFTENKKVKSGFSTPLANKFMHLWFLVGNTPMLELHYKFRGKPGRIFVKCEHYNLTVIKSI